MKIVFVSDAIYPYNKGGKEKRIYDITTRLAQSGHEVHLFCMNWWKGDVVKQENGVTLHGVCPFTPLYVDGRRSMWQAIKFSLKIFFPLLKEKFDVLEADHMPHFPLFTCRLVCWLKRKKLIATWHEVWGKNYWIKYLDSKPAGYIGYLVEKISTKLPDKYIAVSEMTGQRLQKVFQVKPEKIVYIPNGIKLPENIQLEDKQYDLVFAGRLLSHKKADVFIKTVKEIPGIKALIIGQGPEQENLIKLTKELNLEDRVEISGFLEDEEFLQKIKSSKIFLSCSVREGFGIAVLEALSQGLPTIVIEHPDNASTFLIKNNYNGFTSPLDPKKISLKVKEILNNPELFKSMQQGAIKKSKEFSWTKIIDKVIETYNVSK